MRRQVLLVDDDDLLLRHLARWLRTAGFEVTTASSGEEALSLAEQHLPCALVADVVLPGTSGLELAAQLRARDPKLPLVVMSGHDQEVVGSMGTLPENSQFLLKPFGRTALGDAMTRAMGDK